MGIVQVHGRAQNYHRVYQDGLGAIAQENALLFLLNDNRVSLPILVET